VITSFKNLPAKDNNSFSGSPENSTSGLNIATSKQPINISYNESNLAPPLNYLSSSQVVSSFRPLAEQQNPAYNLSTIKYVYNPFQNAVVYPNHSLYAKPDTIRAAPIFHAAPRINYGDNNRIVNNDVGRPHFPQMVSPTSSSNNSSTSIMHPHLFSR
jgi:hypothetical protein